METDKWNPTTGERSDQDNLPASYAARGWRWQVQCWQLVARPSVRKSRMMWNRLTMAGLDLELVANRP